MKANQNTTKARYWKIRQGQLWKMENLVGGKFSIILIEKKAA
jgi:hypothetical protein